MRRALKYLAIGMIVGLVIVFIINSVYAVSNNIRICHKNNGNGWSSITVDPSAIDGDGNSDHNRSGHQGGQDIIPPGYWDHNGRNWDTSGQAIWNNNCNVPSPTVVPTSTPTPTLQPTATPTPTLEPGCDGDCEEVTPTPEVTREPTPTQEPSTPHNDEVLTNNTTQTPGVCIPRDMKIKPTVWGIYRADNGNIQGWISNTEDYINSYVVWYGLWDGDMRWNTTVNGRFIDIAGTPKTHIWVAAQSTDGCGTGPLGAFIDP